MDTKTILVELHNLLSAYDQLNSRRSLTADDRSMLNWLTEVRGVIVNDVIPQFEDTLKRYNAATSLPLHMNVTSDTPVKQVVGTSKEVMDTALAASFGMQLGGLDLTGGVGGGGKETTNHQKLDVDSDLVEPEFLTHSELKDLGILD